MDEQIKPQDEMIKGELKTVYIKGWRLCIDAFGDMPIWTIQHPVKEAEDYYMLKMIDFTVDKHYDLINVLERLEKIDNMWFTIYINAKIKYRICTWEKNPRKDEYFKIIEEIRIDKIEIENDKEPGQP